MQRHGLFSLCVVVAATACARAEVKTKDVTYTHDGVTFHGHLAWDDAATGKRPGVLVIQAAVGDMPHFWVVYQFEMCAGAIRHDGGRPVMPGFIE